MWDTCGPCIDWYTFLPRPLPPLPRPRPLPRPLAEVVLRAGLPLTAALAAGAVNKDAYQSRTVEEPAAAQYDMQKLDVRTIEEEGAYLRSGGGLRLLSLLDSAGRSLSRSLHNMTLTQCHMT
ncbi:MAG: hypothetical protein FRX49_11260 [Trebouxia sp. A1-2]|nr:MAG: hypothetical protein FRX49_11260 [Trebouxia sp. A1-2]